MGIKLFSRKLFFFDFWIIFLVFRLSFMKIKVFSRKLRLIFDFWVIFLLDCHSFCLLIFNWII